MSTVALGDVLADLGPALDAALPASVAVLIDSDASAAVAPYVRLWLLPNGRGWDHGMTASAPAGWVSLQATAAGEGPAQATWVLDKVRAALVALGRRTTPDGVRVSTWTSQDAPTPPQTDDTLSTSTETFDAYVEAASA